VRVFVTGGSGFVGAHVVRVLEGHGAEVAAPRHADVDVTDARAVHDSLVTFRPDALVHCAILNDLGALYADRRAGWDAYVGATRNLVDASNDVGARMLLVSTDWVFDGTQSGATEDTPPNPVNLYGFLKAASEIVVTERAERGSIARIAAVQGVSAAPREQDAGFGYFVAALVDRLRAGRRFGVWESDRINIVATPTLASEAAELMWRIVERDLDGIFHCCGGESVDRRTLATRAVEVFGLDTDLLDLGVPPPEDAVPALRPDEAPGTHAASRPPAAAAPNPHAAAAPVAIPYDTSLDATRTAAALDAELPDVTEMLRRMCRELTPV
jgi:dTDP-4-dehydrorhamnose reductase